LQRKGQPAVLALELLAEFEHTLADQRNHFAAIDSQARKIRRL